MKWMSCLPGPRLWPAALLTVLAFAAFNVADSQVLTRNYNNQRTGANLSETTLTTSNVNTNQFGKLFQISVDDQVYAGMLYVPGLTIAGGTHNVLYVATVNNTVYAFDADTGGSSLWQRNFNGTGRPTTRAEVGQACGTYNDFSGNIGIVGTPVIDGTTNTIYLVTRTVEGSATVQRLRALDIVTGADRTNSPQVIQATVAGTGDGAVGGNIAFNSVTHNQRPALALSAGIIYIGWASFCDTRPYHGWLMAYDAVTLGQVGVFNATPTGNQAGIWMAGAGPAFDASGNLYVPTGNGTFDGTTNFGESLVKLAPRTLNRLDFFTPSNFSSLNSSDLDFGGGGPVMVPGTTMLVTGGKQGKEYLLNATSLGGTVSGDTQIPQSWQAADTTARPTSTHHLHNTGVFWNSPQGLNLYTWGENDFLRGWRFNATTQRFNMPAFAVGSVLPPVGMPGGLISVSANGSQAGSGIVWVTQPSSGDSNQMVVPGVLRAFNAETLALLWSSTAAADSQLNFSKGAGGPMVINGKVYAASFSNSVSVYGLRAAPRPNLALNKPATGSTPCNSNETPAKAFNGSVSGGNTDKWCSLTAPRFLQVDLGASFNVDQFVIRHAGAGGESTSFNTRDFNIQVSADGTNFSTVVTVTGNTASVTTHNITPTAARFVRLNVTTPTQTTDGAARIYEFEVYGSGSATITYEAESLPVAGFSSPDVERIFSDSNTSGGQGVILEGNAVNDFVTFTVNVPEARTYDIRVRIKRWNNRGIWQFDSNGVNLGSPVDGFASSPAYPEIDLGSMAFTSAGNKSFKFRVTGKNASSSSFWIAVDYIRLIPQ